MSPSSPRGQTEREFGVPVPGRILPPDQWTQTALKRLPAGRWDWGDIFGRAGPVVLDLGCGNGRSTLASAVWRTDRLHLGVDVLPLVIRYATRRANQRGLANVRFAVIGGRELLADHVPPGSTAEIHCYHPQPYYTAAEIGKRLITPELLALVHRALAVDGRFYIQTDNPEYWRYIAAVVPAFFELHVQPGPWPDSPKGRTRREIIALREGLPVFRAWGAPRSDVTPDAALDLARTLPPPVFNADRTLQRLDDLERRLEG